MDVNNFPDTNDEIDEHLFEMTFESGGTISKGIPWTKYTEKEIQGILKIHFEILGYDVVWRHRDDPSNEGGIDLECKKDGITTVIIAVKKKPNKNALAQLVELSNQKVKNRIYVYVGGAVQSFRDNMGNFPNVEFWNESILEDKLSVTNLTLHLKIDNSSANHAMYDIMGTILSLIKKEKYNPTENIPQNITDILWAMKDRAVTANRCVSMAQLLFERSDMFGELTSNQIHDIAIRCMDYLFVYALLSLQIEFNSFHPAMRNLFQIAHVNTRTRSNWFELYTYRPGLLPGHVLHTIDEHEREKEKMKPLMEKIAKKTKNEVLPDMTRTKLDVLADEFRRIAIWTDGLESTIDYLYQYRNELNQERIK